MENRNLEKRYIREIRAVGDSREIQGTAIVFNSPSVDMGYTEIILPGAITQELIDSSDIVFLYNHEESLVPLARSKKGKGSLKVILTSDGVDFSFKVRKTSLGDEVLEAIIAGDLDSCSFAFSVDEDLWDKLPDGNYQRTILRIEYIRDFSVVPFPAYQSTIINTRGLDELKAKEELEKRVEPIIEPVVEPTIIQNVEPVVEPVKNELEEYYTSYQIIIDKLKN